MRVGAKPCFFRSFRSTFRAERAQRESSIEPNRVLYDYGQKAMSLERYRYHTATVATPARFGHTLNVSLPFRGSATGLADRGAYEANPLAARLGRAMRDSGLHGIIPEPVKRASSEKLWTPESADRDAGPFAREDYPDFRLRATIRRFRTRQSHGFPRHFKEINILIRNDVLKWWSRGESNP